MCSRLSNELMLMIFQRLSRRDLIQTIQVSHQWYHLANVFLYREVSFPLSWVCHRCVRRDSRWHKDERQRLRVISALLDQDKAVQIEQLYIVERQSPCSCSPLPATVIHSDMSCCSRLWFVSLCNSLINAPRLRTVSVTVERLMLSLDPLLHRFNPSEVKVLLPKRKLLPSLRNTQYLPRLRSAPFTRSHSLTALRSLDLHLDRADLVQSIERNVQIDLSKLKSLERLEVSGTMWSDFEDAFVGSSASIRSCILRGPLVVGTRSQRFFDRFASGLTSLFCHEVHLVSRVDTIFPELTLLGLHHTIHATGIFPFSRSSLRTVLLELSDLGDVSEANDVASVAQTLVNEMKPSLETMFVHSNSMAILQDTCEALFHTDTPLVAVMVDTSTRPSSQSGHTLLSKDMATTASETSNGTDRAHILATTTLSPDSVSTSAETLMLDATCCQVEQRRRMLKRYGVINLDFQTYMSLYGLDLSGCAAHAVHHDSAPTRPNATVRYKRL